MAGTTPDIEISSDGLAAAYRADLSEIVAHIFRRGAGAQTPRCIVDLRAGDGTRLRLLHRVAVEATGRGEHDDPALLVVAVDDDDDSLDAARRSLAGHRHLVVRGNLDDPEALLARLRGAGVNTADDALFVHSSVGDARSTRARVAAAENRASIAPAWRRIVGRHGLIVGLEHAGSTTMQGSGAASADPAPEAETDAAADTQLLQAAAAGLLPVAGFGCKYPRSGRVTVATLNWLERRDYCVRAAEERDFEALVRLELAYESEGLRVPPAVIRERLGRREATPLVIDIGARVVGVLYTQRLRDPSALDSTAYVDVHRLHAPEAAFGQLVSINVAPEVQDRALGDQLLEFALQWLAAKSGIAAIVAVTRCKRFDATRGSLESYIRERDASGALCDPILHFHESHGAEVIRPVHGYRPGDTSNGGAGVLIRYDVDVLSARKYGRRSAAVPATSGDRPREPAALVLAALAEVVGAERAAALPSHRQLRDVGFDSVDLLRLRAALERLSGVPVPPTLFFEHGTPAAIARYLSPPAVDGTSKHAPSDGCGGAAAESGGPIAIVGASCRFPGGVDTLQGFWALLEAGGDAVGEVPAERWEIGELADPTTAERWERAVRHGGFLRDVDRFDPQFFDIAPREAKTMDPQQRLVLELGWEALENAAIDPRSLAGSATGVFVGMYSHDYEYLQLASGGEPETDIYFATGNNASIAAGRLSYVLGLRGPALCVNTACSSSLVAIHLACKSLRSGESDLALACGVNLMLSPHLSRTFARANMLSPSGRCRTFDAAADGYVRGEGAAVVVLKTLSRAQADGDSILAVIKGTAINQDGASNGLTAPSRVAQCEVIAKALSDAGVRACDVSYVEAHGTGTPLGDPVEVAALGEVYGHERPRSEPLVIGSVKTNIGHTESAAGIAGLLKVALALRHRFIPAHLHFQAPNPHLDLASIPAVVMSVGAPWAAKEGMPRLAGVSSFGFSGTNAHVILGEAPPAVQRASGPQRPLELLTLSARSAAALRRQAGRLADFIDAEPQVALADLCHTANGGRAHLEHRIAAVCESPQKLAGMLRAYAERGRFDWDDVWAATMPGRGTAWTGPRVAFLFPGTGTATAASSLLETSAPFRAALLDCEQAAGPLLGEPLSAIVRGDVRASTRVQIDASVFAQQYALCRLWRSWGMEPFVLLAQGKGDYAAACAAGVLRLEDALALTVARALALAEHDAGCASAALLGDSDSIVEVLQGRPDVRIAAVNDADSIVVTGPEAALDELFAELATVGARAVARRPGSSLPLVQTTPSLERLESLLDTVELAPTRVPLLLDAAEPQVTDPRYWRERLRQPVMLAAQFDALRRMSPDLIVELGPLGLAATGRRNVGLSTGADGAPAEWLPSLGDGATDWRQVLTTLARFHLRGGAVDWRGFGRGHEARKAHLPTYSFERDRIWLDPPGASREPRREPGAESVEAMLRRSAAAARQSADTFSGSIADVRASLDSICALYAQRALRALGWDARSHRGVSASDLAERLSVAPRHRRLLARLLEIVEEGTPARQSGTRGPSRDDGDPDAQLDELRAAHPELEPELALLARCSRSLGDVLCGREDPLALIFPGGSLDDATRLYERSSFSAASNAMLSAVVATISGLPPGSRTLRILELGAGTGGSTAHLLRAAPPNRVEYVFTDVASLFTARAAERFRQYDFVRYRLLDIGKDPREQGFALRSFDLVVASNVLHATPDLRASVARARDLLAPGGRLLLTEGVAKTRWIDLIFGLTEGWWLFADHDLRPDYPLLSSSQWIELLRSCGFEHAEAIMNAAPGGAMFEQALLIAKAADAPAARFPVSSAREARLHPLLDSHVRPAFDPRKHIFEARVDDRDQPWLGDHRVDGRAVFPAAGYVELTLAAAREAARDRNVELLDLDLRQAMFVDRDAARRVQVVLTGEAATFAVRVFSAPADQDRRADPPPWQCHADARLARGAARAAQPADAGISKSGTAWSLDAAAHYDLLASVGLDYGPAFRRVAAVHGDDTGATALLTSSGADTERGAGWVIDPTLLDGLLQLSVALAARRDGEAGAAVWLPVRIARCVVRRAPASEDLRAVAEHVRGAAADGRTFETNLRLVTAHGETLAELSGVVLRRVAHVGAPKREQRLYRLSWRAAASPSVAADTGRPLFVGAGGGLSARELAELAAASYFRGAAPDAMRDAAELRERLAALAGGSLPWRRVVFVAPDGGAELDADAICAELLGLVQALLQHGGAMPSLVVVTANAQPTGHETADLALPQAALNGFCRVVALEHPELRCRHVDLDGDAPVAVRAETLIRDLTVDDGEDEVAYRGDSRFVARLVTYSPLGGGGRLDPLAFAGGTSLITGGFGALGLAVARWVAAHGSASIALVGRREPDAVAQESIAALRRSGVTVSAHVCDVADRATLAAVIGEARSAGRELHGVFHLAGTLADGVLLEQTPSRISEVFRAKVVGARNLHELTEGSPLACFVLFSSWASVLGSPGQSNHSAANAYMDALALHRRRLGLPALSVNWAAWLGGGSASQHDRVLHLASRGIGAFSQSDALEHLGQLLTEGAVQVAVMPLDLERWRARSLSAAASKRFDELETPTASKQLRREQGDAAEEFREASAAGAALVERLESFLSGQLSTTLGMERARLAHDATFQSLGLDSLTGLEFRNRLEKSSGMTLSPTLVWNYPTVQKLAAHFAARISAERSANDATSPGSVAPEDSIDSLLDEIESLSDDSARRLLGRQAEERLG